MGKFRNDTHTDVFIDVGELLRVAPGEVIHLAGILSKPPLTPVGIPVPEPTLPKKTYKKPPKKKSPRSTSGTI